MRAVDILRKKRDGEALDRSEIEAFVHGVTTREWPDYQASALLMAIFLRGMNANEAANPTRAMVESGRKLDWGDLPGPKVDKHSTGGVGDKTSLILAPLAAACGCVVPMMSGRGLGHTGGTLDKLESIPGFRVDLSIAEMRKVLKAVGCALVGQTGDVAPADKILYALRDVTATVESIPLITASIMSKKIAEGIDALVMDVKCGKGAFMKTPTDACALANSLVTTGESNGVRTQALLTSMDAPLGRAIGNTLEVQECIETLKGNAPSDLEMLSVALAARMVHLGGLARTLDEAEQKVRQALNSGAGLEKFRAIIDAQGGDSRVLDEPSRLPTAPHQMAFKAKTSGFVTELHAERVGVATMLLGAGRNRVEHSIDPAVGVVIKVGLGGTVRAGDELAHIHYRSDAHLHGALHLLEKAWKIEEAPPTVQSIILDTITH